MLDNYLIKFLKPLLNILATFLYKMKVGPNTVTLFGLFLSFISFFLIMNFNYKLALFFFILGRLMDGIDGTLANKTTKSDFGGFLDIVCDFIAYSIIPLGFILSIESNSFFGAILLSTFFGTGSTFLAIAIFEKNKEITEQYNKSFYHVGGLIGGFITIVFLTLMLIFPNNFNFIAIIFSILCILGTIERIYYGYNILR